MERRLAITYEFSRGSLYSVPITSSKEEELIVDPRISLWRNALWAEKEMCINEKTG